MNKNFFYRLLPFGVAGTLWLGMAFVALLVLRPDLGLGMSYVRSEVDGGQTWRLFTGALSHVGLAHFCLNAAGVALLLTLFKGWQKVSLWLVFAALCFGVFLLEHSIGTHAWARGLSGPAYGLAVYGSLLYLKGPSRIAIAGGTVFMALWQGVTGMEGTAPLIGAPVLWQHHVYGASLGFALAGMAALFRWLRAAPVEVVQGSQIRSALKSKAKK